MFVDTSGNVPEVRNKFKNQLYMKEQVNRKVKLNNLETRNKTRRTQKRKSYLKTKKNR